jgi:hypothetical protein
MQVAPGDLGDDTVEVGDLSLFIVREAAAVLTRCVELSPTHGKTMQEFTDALMACSCVDASMLDHGLEVARAEGLFRLADHGGDGRISRNELYKMIKRVKVPITKAHFKMIFRVMDPDQSYQIDMVRLLNILLPRVLPSSLRPGDCV